MPRARHADRRPDPEPLEADEPRVAVVGTALFAVALVALLLVRDRLEAAGTEWMIGTCVTGVALGLFGLVYTRRRRVAIARRTVPAERQARQPEPPVRRPHAPGPVPRDS